MGRLKINISLLLSVITMVVAASSCQRKPLYDDCVCHNELSIPVDVDWRKSGVAPQNVTILVYDRTTGDLVKEHTYEHNDKDIQSYLLLPSGSFKVVVVNELRGQIDYVDCVGYANFETLKFESQDDVPLISRAPTRGYVKQPGELAVAYIDSIVITDDMIVEGAIAAHSGEGTKALSEATKAVVESMMNVVPEKKTATVNIRVRIKNLYYALMPALVDLTNLADGYFVSGDRNSSTPSTLQFMMEKTEFENMYDGVMWTSITTFGPLVDRGSVDSHANQHPIALDMLFKLIDEDMTEANLVSFVTHDIVFEQQTDGSMLLTIDVEMTEALPAVKPAGSSGDSGFGSGIDPWDKVEVPLPQG